MRELNVYHHELRPNEYAEFYLKYEADKVIAELKEIDSKNRLAYYKDLSMMAKDVERHKYKRCLAMAEWCENALLGWMGDKESYSSHQRYIKVMLFTKWRKRWLELAEKFKETK